MKRAITAIIMAGLLCLPITAEGIYPDVLVTEIVSVYDGDTFRCHIRCFPEVLGENIGIRVYGIDTPEIRDKRPEIKALAYEARDRAKETLTEGKVIILRDLRRGKYFRLVAEVWVDGENLAGILIEEGLAKEYYGGTKPEWGN